MSEQVDTAALVERVRYGISGRHAPYEALAALDSLTAAYEDALLAGSLMERDRDAVAAALERAERERDEFAMGEAKQLRITSEYVARAQKAEADLSARNLLVGDLEEQARRDYRRINQAETERETLRKSVREYQAQLSAAEVHIGKAEAELRSCDAALEAVGGRVEMLEATLRGIDVGSALTAWEMRDRARAALVDEPPTEQA